MVMLKGYGRIVDFFTSFEWWKMEPRPDLVTGRVLCLAEPGRQYVVYLPSGGAATVALEAGVYRAAWYNPRTGEQVPIGEVQGGGPWTSPAAPGAGDWVLRIVGSGEPRWEPLPGR
jgi:hypothetical protein